MLVAVYIMALFVYAYMGFCVIIGLPMVATMDTGLGPVSILWMILTTVLWVAGLYFGTMAYF